MKGGRTLDIFLWAVILQVIMFFYFEVTTLINLFPWNDLSKYSYKERILEATVNGIIIIIGLALFVSKVKWLMVISASLWFAFLLMQLLTWWMPYLTGRHLKQFPKELYDTHFQETIKVLPPIKNHIIPDVQHNILQMITLATFVTSLITVIS